MLSFKEKFVFFKEKFVFFQRKEHDRVQAIPSLLIGIGLTCSSFVGRSSHRKKLLREILQEKNQGTPRHVALYNAAGALVVAGKAENLRDGVEQATQLVESGKAWQRLEELVKFTNQAA